VLPSVQLAVPGVQIQLPQVPVFGVHDVPPEHACGAA